MKQIINLEINHQYDLFEKYNHQKVSRDLIMYLLNECDLLTTEYQILIIDNVDISADIVTLIKTALYQEFLEQKRTFQITNVKQIWLLAVGIILLLISMNINEHFVFKEVILIAGWVLIWETIDIQIFSDTSSSKIIKKLKTLLQSEIKVKKNI